MLQSVKWGRAAKNLLFPYVEVKKLVEGSGSVKQESSPWVPSQQKEQRGRSVVCKTPSNSIPNKPPIRISCELDSKGLEANPTSQLS